MNIKTGLFAIVLALSFATLAQAETQFVVHLEALDPLSDPISEIPLGGDFELRAFVQDVRDSTPIGGDLFGVYAAYVDVGFDGSKASETGPLVVDDYFDDLPAVTLSIVSPGFARGGGATLDLTNPGPAEQLLFTIPLHADSPGTILFTPAYFGDNIAYEWLAFGDGDPIPVENVQFSSLEVTIVPEPAGMALFVVGAVAIGAVMLRKRKTTS